MHVYFFLSLFWLHWSLQAFPSFREWGLSLWTSHRRGVSCCGVQTLGGSWASEAVDPSLYSGGSVIVAHGDSGVCRILPDKESNQRPPALAGRSFSTGPPGMPWHLCLFFSSEEVQTPPA